MTDETSDSAAGSGGEDVHEPLLSAQHALGMAPHSAPAQSPLQQPQQQPSDAPGQYRLLGDEEV